MDDAAIEMLRQLCDINAEMCDELRGLRSDLAAARSADKWIDPGDRSALQAFRRALRPHVSDERSFSVAEIVLAARSEFGADLRDRIEAAIGGELDEGAARKLGRFLARTAGSSVDGHRLERQKAQRDGATWRFAPEPREFCEFVPASNLPAGAKPG